MARDYTKLDTWSLRAQKEGYPARSVYKLSEINEKFHILKPHSRPSGKVSVIDLGSAPGSWTQWLLQNCRDTTVLSCDLNDLTIDPSIGSERGNKLLFFKGDLTSSQMQAQIKEYAPFSLVVCDAAPKTTGNRLVDSATSEQIVKMATFYADYIVKGGNFVAKLFQGSDGNLLKVLQNTFETVKTFKPAACRKESFETYLVAMGKKQSAPQSLEQ